MPFYHYYLIFPLYCFSCLLLFVYHFRSCSIYYQYRNVHGKLIESDDFELRTFLFLFSNRRWFKRRKKILFLFMRCSDFEGLKQWFSLFRLCDMTPGQRVFLFYWFVDIVFRNYNFLAFVKSESDAILLGEQNELFCWNIHDTHIIRMKVVFWCWEHTTYR